MRLTTPLAAIKRYAASRPSEWLLRAVSLAFTAWLLGNIAYWAWGAMFG